MEGMPSPLQAGFPTSEKRSSVEEVPSALRVGSISTEYGCASWDTRSPLTRKNTSGSNRLSQLFPSRPSSISSISPPTIAAASTGNSYPHPLIPAAEPRRGPWSPAPPPPPSFSDVTVYEPFAGSFENRDASALLQSRKSTKKLFNRLTSLRGASSRSGSYNRINDKESHLGKRELVGVEEGDENTYHSYNAANPIPLDHLISPNTLQDSIDIKEQRDINEAGYAAEYERLEAKVQLGAGMSSITERPFTYDPTSIGTGSYSRQPGGIPNTNNTVLQARDAQEEAEKTGGIVAVAEIPVDISESFSGGDFETRSMMASSAYPRKDEAQKSYFFPKGLYKL